MAATSLLPLSCSRSERVTTHPRSLVHGELVAQGEVLQGELAMAAAEDGRSRNTLSRRVIIELRFSPDQGR
jgi:hypothetical protein